MLYAGNACFQGAHVGRDLCTYRTPVSAGGIANGLDFLVDLFDRRCGSSTSLLLRATILSRASFCAASAASSAFLA
jgi:hypothetical protein